MSDGDAEKIARNAELVTRVSAEISAALDPLMAKYPGLEAVVCFSVPNPHNPGKHSVAFARTHTLSMFNAMELLAHVCKDVLEKLKAAR